jgi:hypothetical protein
MATTLGKAGNTRAGKFVPRVAESNCHEHSAKGPLPTAPLGKEVSFKFYFFALYIDKHTQDKFIILLGVATPALKKHFVYVYIPIYQLEYVNIPKIRFIKVITMKKIEWNS